MTEYVINPRRAPRAVVGCEARVALKTGEYFEGPAVDYGPGGCQLVAPAPVSTEERVYVELKNQGVPSASRFAGKVAWAAGEQPYRLGVAFDEGSRDDAAHFYGELAAAHPDLVDVEDVPDRVPLDATVKPSRQEGDEAVLQGEQELLLAIGSGTTLRALRDRLGPRWDAAVNPLFALLARRLLRVEEQPAP
jgi:hypothetical protein